ncbi:MAG TPA: SPOR domain-containing protein [Blastocatellia bacterium]|nr:SPOR domain-containing protein [Blastocatellia bacterium]
MSNKQVVAIFVVGTGLLLAVFWMGLSVVKQSNGASASPAVGAAPGDAAGPGPDQGSAAVEPPQTTSGNSLYVVQAGIFGTAEQANQFTTELKRKFRAAYTQSPEPGGQDKLYRVNIGPYDKRDADQVASELSGLGYKGIMILPASKK